MTTVTERKKEAGGLLSFPLLSTILTHLVSFGFVSFAQFFAHAIYPPGDSLIPQGELWDPLARIIPRRQPPREWLFWKKCRELPSGRAVTLKRSFISLFLFFFCLRCVCLFYVLLFFPLSFTRARWGPVCGFVSFIGEMGSHVAPAGGFNTFFKLALFLSGVSLREQLQHNLTFRIALGKCCWTQQLCVHPHVHLFPCGSHWKVF